MENEKEKRNAIQRGRQKVWLPERMKIKMLHNKIKKEERELPDKVYEIIGCIFRTTGMGFPLTTACAFRSVRHKNPLQAA